MGRHRRAAGRFHEAARKLAYFLRKCYSPFANCTVTNIFTVCTIQRLRPLPRGRSFLLAYFLQKVYSAFAIRNIINYAHLLNDELPSASTKALASSFILNKWLIFIYKNKKDAPTGASVFFCFRSSHTSCDDSHFVNFISCAAS